MANIVSSAKLAVPAVSFVAKLANTYQMADMKQQFAHYRDRLKEAMKARRIGNEELASRLDVHPVTISKLRAGRMKLTEEWRARLAGGMEMSEEELFGSEPIKVLPGTSAPRKPRSRRSLGDKTMIFDPAGRRMLEVWGLAAGSVAGQMMISSDPISEVPAPPALASVFGAYVLMTKGESMVPRYFPNDYLYINPHQAVRPGDHVVIQTHTEDRGHLETWVKRFDGEDDQSVFAWQYNPPGRIEFKKRFVEHVHRILPVNELMLG